MNEWPTQWLTELEVVPAGFPRRSRMSVSSLGLEFCGPPFPSRVNSLKSLLWHFCLLLPYFALFLTGKVKRLE